MHGLVKNVFILVGTMTASLLLFYLMFIGPGRTLMWQGTEPSFKHEWNNATQHNGDETSQIFNTVFDTAEDISG